MAKIVVDPITRIEGHLRIEAQIEGGKIVDAWASGTMWRGIETILKGRDPRDAWTFVSRFCGVCTTVHSIASVRAVENALGIQIPDNARIIRDLIMGFQTVHDHVMHFYHLHGLDWVDVVSALKADPAKTAALASSISDWPNNASVGHFKAIQAKVKAFVESGQLGIFANGYWGHKEYRLPAEANLMAVAHYLEALDWQRDIIRAHAMVGAKNPHPQTFLVGGMSIPVDPNSQNAINAGTIAALLDCAEKALEFVEKVYIPDLLAVASFYKDWAGYGSFGNFLSCGEHPDANGKYYFPAGIVMNRDLSKVHPLDHKKFAEYVSNSWYSYAGGDDKGMHPWDGETTPNYTGPKTTYKELDTDKKYSWVKSPRYDNQPMEVGPLAKILVAYASGHADVKGVVDMVLKKLDVPATALFSTLGRTAARGIDTLLTAKKLQGWIMELAANIKKGDYRIANTDKWDPSTWPKEAKGVGFHDAPRGALAHFIVIRDGKIANYQAVVPTTWNAGPRDPRKQRGPYEASLIGTPVANPEQPIEIIRTIHSFDPCMACAIHAVDASGKEIVQVKVR
ncbi:MAG: nickel-dependent hydrogenase large subunit [Nitrospiraceae bacterium]|jgi:[NiFe] hydrogenase large subunit/hydrogenase large subunit|nr:nickel-dependent hydrogenase large subunit [Nitrospiraceae bacterium]